MNWKEGEYSFLKEEILELVRKNLLKEHAIKLTFKESMDAIDKFVEALKNGKGIRG